MNSSRKLRVILMVATSVLEVHPVSAQNVDINILKEINPRNPDSHVWMQTSNSVYFAPLSIAATQMAYGIITKNKQARNKSCELLMSIGLGTLISQNMKVAVNRTRPQDKYPNEIFSLSPTHTKSFPSGHTAMAFATA